MKKEKNISKFTPEEVEGDNSISQSSEVKDLISDTEAFFKEDEETDNFSIEPCEDCPETSMLSGVLSEFDVFYVEESKPDKIRAKRVRALNKSEARDEFLAQMTDEVEITGIEEVDAEDNIDDMVPEFYVDEDSDDDDDGDDYTEETPAYIYDVNLD